MGEINWLFAIIYTHLKLWTIRANNKLIIGQEIKKRDPHFSGQIQEIYRRQILELV